MELRLNKTMRLATVVLSLLAVPAAAQTYPPDGGGGLTSPISSSDIDFPLLGPDGDLEEPPFSFLNYPTSGMLNFGGTVVIQNKGIVPDALGRSRGSFGTSFWSFYAVDDASGTVQGFAQASDEGSAEVRVRLGSTVDTANETELYLDPDEISGRVEDTGVNVSTFNFNETDMSLTKTDGSTSGAVNINEEGPKDTTTGSQPTCDLAARGRRWRTEGGAGVADTYEICAKNTSDTYAWYALATIP